MDALLGNLNEYDNIGGLLTGLDGTDEEMVGALEARPAEVQRNIIERIRQYRPSGQTKARAEFEARWACCRSASARASPAEPSSSRTLRSTTPAR